MKINSILKRAFILNPEPAACFLSMSVSIQQIAILSLGNFPKNLPFLLGSFLKGIFRPGGRMKVFRRERKKSKHWKVNYGFLKQNENISDRRYLL